MSVDALNRQVWSYVESSLTPHVGHQLSVVHLLPSFFLVPLGLATMMLAAVEKVIRGTTLPTKTGTFEDVVNDSREWENLGDIEQELIKHPPRLDFGVATCTYQDSYQLMQDSQWTPYVQTLENCTEQGANLFELYKTPEVMIKKLQKLCVTSYRFSIEWSHLQASPKAPLNSEVLNVYVNFAKALQEVGIKPVVTLHHFSEPQWFFVGGSFENHKNIENFVNFAEQVVDALAPHVKTFCTINEPAIEASSRYVLGTFPSSPEKLSAQPCSLIHRIFNLFSHYFLKRNSTHSMLNFSRAGKFLHGTFKAHTAVYNAIKTKHLDIQLGIVHQYIQFIPTHFLLNPVTRYFTLLMNTVQLHYFQTGKLSLKMPFCHLLSEDEIPPNDFVGLQYYARPVIGLAGPTSFDEPMTRMPYREDPAGLYTAIIDTFNHCKKPILITENGISAVDDNQRHRYNTRALKAVKEAANKIGVENLKAYYYWSIVRNLEWNMGMQPQDFGAYALENGQMSEDPKPGMTSFIKIANALKSMR